MQSFASRTPAILPILSRYTGSRAVKHIWTKIRSPDLSNLCILKIKKKQPKLQWRSSRGFSFLTEDRTRPVLHQHRTKQQRKLCWPALKAGKYEEGTELLSWHQAKASVLQTKGKCLQSSVQMSYKAQKSSHKWKSRFKTLAMVFFCLFVWTKVSIFIINFMPFMHFILNLF